MNKKTKSPWPFLIGGVSFILIGFLMISGGEKMKREAKSKIRVAEVGFKERERRAAENYRRRLRAAGRPVMPESEPMQVVMERAELRTSLSGKEAWGSVLPHYGSIMRVLGLGFLAWSFVAWRMMEGSAKGEQDEPSTA